MDITLDSYQPSFQRSPSAPVVRSRKRIDRTFQIDAADKTDSFARKKLKYTSPFGAPIPTHIAEAIFNIPPAPPSSPTTNQLTAELAKITLTNS